MQKSKHKGFENYKKIRKPMPPPTKVIQLKNKRDKFDWKEEISKGET